MRALLCTEENRHHHRRVHVACNATCEAREGGRLAGAVKLALGVWVGVGVVSWCGGVWMFRCIIAPHTLSHMRRRVVRLLVHLGARSEQSVDVRVLTTR